MDIYFAIQMSNYIRTVQVYNHVCQLVKTPRYIFIEITNLNFDMCEVEKIGRNTCYSLNRK